MLNELKAHGTTENLCTIFYRILLFEGRAYENEKRSRILSTKKLETEMNRSLV
jgi:hypothetical protein